MSRSLYARLSARLGRGADAITRREMLRKTLEGAAGLLLSNALGFGQGNRAAGKRVIVVGAGWLYAGWRLGRQNGNPG